MERAGVRNTMIKASLIDLTYLEMADGIQPTGIIQRGSGIGIQTCCGPSADNHKVLVARIMDRQLMLT